MNEHVLPQDDDAPDTLFRELFSPHLSDRLASLALLSEEAADVAEGLERMGHLLQGCVRRPSDLRDTLQLLRRKVEQLRDLNVQLSRKVMRHSLLLEDVAPIAVARDGGGAEHDAEGPVSGR